MINLFLDTNIYLGFLRLSNNDLGQLIRLTQLISDTEDIRLFITDQVKDEYLRNRENVLAESMNQALDSIKGLNQPSFFKEYPEYVGVRESFAKFKSLMQAFEEKIKEDINNSNLPPDIIIGSLMSIAVLGTTTDEIYSEAIKRFNLGKPPGKKGSYGDAINWELLIETIPTGEDVYIVSNDGDYKSPQSSKSIKSYLSQEWERRHGGKVYFYENIADFYADKLPNLGDWDEFLKDRTIDKLEESRSFNMSRVILDRLNYYSSALSDSQLTRIARISLENNQIYGAHRYSPEQIGQVFDQLFHGKHNLIPKEIYNSFCETFGIQTELYYYYNERTNCWEEVPF